MHLWLVTLRRSVVGRLPGDTTFGCVMRDHRATRSLLQPSQLSRGVACVHPTRFKVLGDDCASSDDHVGADVNPSEDGHVCTYAHVVVNSRGFLDESLMQERDSLIPIDDVETEYDTAWAEAAGRPDVDSTVALKDAVAANETVIAYAHMSAVRCEPDVFFDPSRASDDERRSLRRSSVQ